jgi:hypothetical protein
VDQKDVDDAADDIAAGAITCVVARGLLASEPVIRLPATIAGVTIAAIHARCRLCTLIWLPSPVSMTDDVRFRQNSTNRNGPVILTPAERT